MKIKVLLLGFALAATCIIGCKSNKETMRDMGNKEIDLPCAGYDKDTKEYFSGMGIGEHVNMQNARTAALAAAQSMLKMKIGGMAKGLTTSYYKTLSGKAVQDDVERIVEGEIATVVDRMLNDSEVICEKLYQTPSGTYQSHIAIRISKEELAKKVADNLSENDKLRIEYDRENFRKFAKKYMERLDEQGR